MFDEKQMRFTFGEPAERITRTKDGKQYKQNLYRVASFESEQQKNSNKTKEILTAFGCNVKIKKVHRHREVFSSTINLKTAKSRNRLFITTPLTKAYINEIAFVIEEMRELGECDPLIEPFIDKYDDEVYRIIDTIFMNQYKNIKKSKATKQSLYFDKYSRTFTLKAIQFSKREAKRYLKTGDGGYDEKIVKQSNRFLSIASELESEIKAAKRY
jgi:hypothetical protein